MDDEPPKPSLADDPDFLASLGDLDQGLGGPKAKPVRPSVPLRAEAAAPAGVASTGDAVPDVPREAPVVHQLSARRGAAAGAAPRRRVFAAFPAAAMAASLPTPLSPPEPVAPVTPEGTGARR